MNPWARLVGPQTTPQQSAAIVAAGLAGAAVAPRAGRPHRRAEAVTLTLLAADLWGGAVANNTLGCARWYERPGQGAVQHLAFAAVHVHPFVIGHFDRTRGPNRARWTIATYGYMVGATALIRAVPRYRRVLGVAATLGAIALDAGLGPSPSAPWFAPMYSTKLLLGHASAARFSDAALAGLTGD